MVTMKRFEIIRFLKLESQKIIKPRFSKTIGLG